MGWKENNSSLESFLSFLLLRHVFKYGQYLGKGKDIAVAYVFGGLLNVLLMSLQIGAAMSAN